MNVFFDHLKKDDKAFHSRMLLKKSYASNIDKENVKEKTSEFFRLWHLRSKVRSKSFSWDGNVGPMY